MPPQIGIPGVCRNRSSKKGPRDINQLAAAIVEAATAEEKPEEKKPLGKESPCRRAGSVRRKEGWAKSVYEVDARATEGDCQESRYSQMAGLTP